MAAAASMVNEVPVSGSQRVKIEPPVGAAATVADQPCAVAARHRQQRQGVGVLAHLRAGVPEHREVARPPVVGVVYHRGMPAHPIVHPFIMARGAGAP